MDSRLGLRRLRFTVVVAACTVVAVAAVVAEVVLAPATRISESPAVRVTLLAVGDTGREARWIEALDGQSVVARGLDWADEQSPADALVLLGDNFYWNGLERGTAVQRIRENVVRPYCRFVSLEGPLSSSVAPGCERPASLRHPIPIYAVLGNHDHASDESPDLESTMLSSYVSNWVLPHEVARAINLQGGVSLVLVDSSRLLASPPGELVAALREATGPWRILVAHHPPGTSDDQNGIYAQRLRDAIAEAGKPVQLVLAGHEHNLQLIELSLGAPALVVVAGSGSDTFPIITQSAGRRFGKDALGFARVQLVGRGEAERLVVTLYETPRWRSAIGGSPIERARWSIDARGEVRDEGKGDAAVSLSHGPRSDAPT